MSTRPQFTASYSAPWPRRCSGASDSPARSLTGPSAHSTASASSDSSSARAIRQAWKSRRNRDSTARGSTPAASSSKLSITAFVRDRCPLTRTHDHAEAALTRRDTPDNTGKTPDQKPQRLNNKLRAGVYWSQLRPPVPDGGCAQGAATSQLVSTGQPVAVSQGLE